MSGASVRVGALLWVPVGLAVGGAHMSKVERDVERKVKRLRVNSM